MLTCRVNRGPSLTPSTFRDFDRLVNSMFRGVPGFLATPEVFFSERTQGGPGAAVPMNVWEDEHNVYVETEVPGVPMESLDISFSAGELTIRGRRPEEPHAEGVTVHRRERATGAEFTRTVKLGIALDADKVSASASNGVLLITLPKAPEAKPRRIAVKPA